MIHLYVCLHATTSDLVTYEPCAQLSTCASNAKNYYPRADTGRWWPVDVGHLMGAADPAAWAQAPVCARSMPLFPPKH
jgi:hypothetical protein